MKEKLCVALGDFDGVHLGHQQLILQAVNNPYNATPAVYTFTQNCKGFPVLMNNSEKEQTLLQLGIKLVVFDDFEKIRLLSPAAFVENILSDKLGCKAVVCGEDYTFGYKAGGDVNKLKELCARLSIDVITVKSFEFKGQKLSSSAIRSMLEQGNVVDVSAALGRKFTISGKVIHGKRLASERATPTVNIALEDGRIIPAYGVYITQTIVDGNVYNSVSNVGVRPSIENNGKPNLETNIFDFAGDIYGKDITVKLIKMMRPERKFANSDELFEQIALDIQNARAYFTENHNNEA